ncbi:MAG: sigma-70 family RNA polymerase sigma factor [Anaerolineales bacterium]|jgi:RNA polymerase sigma-70 factor (ECF subfamily)
MPAKPPFDQLVKSHSREIFHYLYRLLGRTQAAEDALQDAFLRAMRAYDRLEDQANTRAWLYRIAGNVARTQLKRDQRTRIHGQLHDNLPDASPSVAHQVETRERLRALSQAVQRLPHHQRAALVLRKYQGLSYAEIGLALNCSPDSARANVYQALKKLRRTFSQEVDNAG